MRHVTPTSDAGGCYERETNTTKGAHPPRQLNKPFSRYQAKCYARTAMGQAMLRAMREVLT